MREIKFRAWLENEMVYDYEGTVDFLNHGFYTEDVSVMQYTGLKDKNGKEIYEGDIVYSIIQYSGFGEAEYQGVVKYIDYGFKVDPQNENEFFGIMELVDANFEIIGNIYENPELLTNKGE